MPTGQQYGTNVPQTFITGAVASGVTSITVNSSSSWPATPFTFAFGTSTSLQEACDCTNVSGTTWTIVRGVDGTLAQNQPINQTVTHVDIGRDFREARAHIDASTSNDTTGHAVHGLTSGSSVVGTTDTQTVTNKTLVNNEGTTDWFNVKFHGAKGDGTTDDSTAINAAIALANASGGVVYFPQGTYAFATALTPIQTGVVVRGDGKTTTTLKPKTGFLADVISTPIPGTAGTPGFAQNFVGVEDLTIDGSSMTGTTAGQGNGIHFYGVKYSFIRNCNIVAVPNWGILLDGDLTNFSYSNQIQANRIINGSAGIMATFSEENFIAFNDILQANATTSAQQPAFTPQSNVGYLVRLVSGYNTIMGNVIGSSGTYTSAAIRDENSGPTRIIGNRFDQTRYQAINNTGPNIIIEGNQFGNCSSVGSVEVIRVGGNNALIANNIFDLTNGAAHYTYGILEAINPTGCAYTGNNIAAGTSGKISLNAGTTSLVQNNPGYNPVGFAAPPAVPASGTPVANNTGSTASVYIATNTSSISGVTIAGQALPTNVELYIVGPGQSITLTYSAPAPTWAWYLN